MTTVVTRLFANAKTAEQALNALQLQGHPSNTMEMIAAGNGAMDAMLSARVSEKNAKAYAGAMKSGNVVTVVRAPVTPFGAARNAIDTMNEFDTIDVGLDNENQHISEEPSPNIMADLKVDRTHRYWATYGYERPRGLVSDAFGVRTVFRGSGHKTFGTFAGNPIISGTKFFGSFLMPTLSKRKDRTNSVYSGTKYFGSFLADPIARR